MWSKWVFFFFGFCVRLHLSISEPRWHWKGILLCKMLIHCYCVLHHLQFQYIKEERNCWFIISVHSCSATCLVRLYTWLVLCAILFHCSILQEVPVTLRHRWRSQAAWPCQVSTCKHLLLQVRVSHAISNARDHGNCWNSVPAAMWNGMQKACKGLLWKYAEGMQNCKGVHSYKSMPNCIGVQM